MSAKSIAEFSAELRKRNVARPNLFHVSVLPPKSMIGANQEIGLISMWCAAASTPQVSLMTNDNYIEAGTRRKYAYDQDFSDLTLTFYIDQDYKIKKFFDDWKSAVVPNRRNFNYPDDYTAESLILQIINQDDKDVYKYEYNRVYPKTVSPIELSYSNGNSVSTFYVDFVFEDFFYSEINSKSGVETSTTKPDTSIPQEEYTSLDEFINELERENSGWDVTYEDIPEEETPVE